MVASTLFFENSAGKVLVDPAGYLRSHWAAAPRTLADTQAFLRQLLRAMQHHKLGKVLVNQTDMHPLTAQEQAWVSQEWLPQAAEAGYRFGAVIVATNLYARLATAGVTTNPGGLPVRYRSFDHEDQAIAWLVAQ